MRFARPFRSCALFLALVFVALGAPESRAQLTLEVPTGFTFEQVVFPPFGGATVGFTFLPDGRMILIEQNNAHGVRVRLPGAPNVVGIGSIPDVESEYIERGLMGVAIDPRWPTSPYMYFYYTHVSGFCYLTRYTVTGDLTNPASTNLSIASPYHILTDIPDDQNVHQAGTLKFGPLDDYLYVSVGDDSDPCSAQDLTTLGGGILRLDVMGLPATGTGPPAKSLLAPASNPFPGPDENERLVFAWGMRNPFRFTIDPLLGDLYIGDVGANTYEELNFVPYAGGGGDNFGWPMLEGPVPFNCGSCNGCGAGNPNIQPAYFYLHTGPIHTIVAGPRYRVPAGQPLAFPPEYEGSIFFYEHYEGNVRRLVEGQNGLEFAAIVPGQPSVINWSAGLPYVSDFQQGPDGALYLMNVFGNGTERGVFRIAPDVTTDASISPSTVAGPIQVSAAPNPARADRGARISWQASHGFQRARVRIVDVSGQLVRSLYDGELAAGPGSVSWDGRNETGTPVPAGVYFYRLDDSSGGVYGGRLTLLK